MADDADKPTRDPEMDELRREIANLKAAVAERAQDVNEALRARAAVVRDNPGTVSTAFVIGGIIGLLVGMALGQSEHGHRRWYDRH
jgi:hypothetical protein